MWATLAAAGLPALIELLKGVTGAATSRWIGLSVDDQAKLADIEIRRLEAVAKLDNPGGTPSQWVIDVRASSRYVGAGLSILSGVFIVIYSITAISDNLTSTTLFAFGVDLIGIPFGFLFGERIRLSLAGKK